MIGRFHHGILIAIAAAAVTAAASPARADLPPPDGRKYVSYAFRVHGVVAFPEYVLLAFPWSTSDGRPTEEHARLEEGKALPVGRRSAQPRLYAMKRGDYEAFLASYAPPSDNYEDPALRALFASSKVRACDVAPTVVHEIDEDDGRAGVVEVLRAVAMDDARCDLEVTEASPAADFDAPAKGGGCAGCQSTAAPGYPAGALAGLLALLLARRRRRLS